MSLEEVAPEQAPVLQQLFELYCHDFSEQLPLELKASGRFEIPIGSEWWTRDDHFPFFIRRQDVLAGFALVRRGSRVTSADDVMDVAEFFVVRGARRSGVGAAAAREVFARFPGAWEVRVRTSNRAALAFWSRVVAERSGSPPAPQAFERDGAAWQLLRLRA